VLRHELSKHVVDLVAFCRRAGGPLLGAELDRGIDARRILRCASIAKARASAKLNGRPIFGSPSQASPSSESGPKVSFVAFPLPELSRSSGERKRMIQDLAPLG